MTTAIIHKTNIWRYVYCDSYALSAFGGREGTWDWDRVTCHRCNVWKRKG